MKTLKQILSKEAFYYLQGTIRHFLYYTQYLRCFIRPHIVEQIKLRLFVMDTICLTKGTCKMCGCNTPALQMCDKACDKPCYPPILNKAQWGTFTNFVSIHKHSRLDEEFLFKRLAKSKKFIDAIENSYPAHRTRYKVLLDLQRYVKLD